MQATVNITETISKLESQGIRFAPRRRNGLDKFDYMTEGMLTQEQSDLLRELKRDEAAVCRWLVERAKTYISCAREIANSGGVMV